MNDENQPRLLILHSGIFPDSEAVERAVDLIDGYRVEREELTAAALSTGDWDRVLAKILNSEKVLMV